MVESKYYCDICGEEILQKEDRTIPTIYTEGRYGKTSRCNFDLCDNCFNNIFDYIKKLGKEKSGEE